jgi:hypothetical protein
MTKIYVNSDTFENAHKLVSRNEFSRAKVDGPNIIWDEYIFVRTYSVNDDHSTLSSVKNINNRFDCLTKPESKSLGSIYNSFVDSLLEFFYRNNNYLVYEKVEDNTSSKVKDGQLDELMHFLLPTLGNNIRVSKDSSFHVSRVCEVAVKMKLSLGGEPIPVINKFYFEVGPNNLIKPIRGARANSLHLQIEQIAKKTNKTSNSHLNVSPDYLLSQRISEKLLEVLNDEEGFADCLCVDNTSEEKIREYLTSKLDSTALFQPLTGFSKGSSIIDLFNNSELDNIEPLVCSSAKIRYIAFLEYSSNPYIVYDLTSDTPLFKADFGFSNLLNVICLRCNPSQNKPALIEDGYIELSGNKYLINFDDKNFGLPAKENPRLYNPLVRHSTMLSCELHNSGRCNKIVCLDSQVFHCPIQGCKAPSSLCLDCPHDEIVIHKEKNNIASHYHTSCLQFCHDTLSLLPKDETFVCSCCGISYSSSYYKSKGLCNLCYPIISLAGDKLIYEQIYKIHSNLLPYHLRTKLGLANENSKFIIIKNDRNDNYAYILDKKSNKTNMLVRKVLSRSVLHGL